MSNKAIKRKIRRVKYCCRLLGDFHKSGQYLLYEVQNFVENFLLPDLISGVILSPKSSFASERTEK